MDTILELINAAACGLISVVLAGLILSPKVHDGVVVKAGLICLSLGFGAVALLLWDGLTPGELVSLERALMLINAGITVVIVGYLLRKAKTHCPARRSSDWAELVDTRPLKGPEVHR